MIRFFLLSCSVVLIAFVTKEPFLPPKNMAFSKFSKSELVTMWQAGEKVIKLEKKLGSLIPKEARQRVKKLAHYPIGDIFDAKSASQYYFHAHREGEYGHYHLFAREGKEYAHLFAISIDKWGRPSSLFCTSKWVTGEKSYSIEELKEKVAAFEIGHDYPSKELNEWLMAMKVFYRVQIEELLTGEKNKGAISSSLPISHKRQFAMLIQQFSKME